MRGLSVVLLAGPLASALRAPAAAPAGRALVVGGGFGGLYTALDLARKGTRVTLVDARESFCFLPLLYEFAVGAAEEAEVATPYADLVADVDGLDFVRGAVESLDLGARTATLADGSVLRGDALVVALGREPITDSAPGAAEHALPFYRLDHARTLRRTLGSSDPSPMAVVVVGGGYTGVELACHLKQARPQDAVTVLDRGATPCAAATPKNRAAAAAALRSAGVATVLETAVLNVGATTLTVSTGGAERTIDADLVCWTAGARPAAALRSVPREHKKRGGGGALAADGGLRVRATEGVFALGDCASVAGVAAASSAQMSMQQAAVASRNARAFLDGRATVSPFTFVELGEVVSLGGSSAAASAFPALFDDQIAFTGPAAALGRRLLYAARMPTGASRLAALSGLAATAATPGAGGAARSKGASP